MPRRYHLISRLLGAALLPGCLVDTSDSETQSGGTTTSTTTSTTASSLSGSATGAPGTSTGDGTASSVPTMATTSPTGATSGAASTGVVCDFLCDDSPKPDCDPFAQDCPEGQKCAAVISDGGSAWDATRCVDVIGTDKPGEPCTMEDVASGVDSCIEGAMCWDVDVEGVGECVAQCTGSGEAPVCENNETCTLSSEGVVNLCFPTCDPLLQDCPHPGDACYPVINSFSCEPDASGPEGQANDPCEFINVCDPGLMCVDSVFAGKGCSEAPNGCCSPFCKLPGGVCPNPDQQCVQFFDPMQLPPGDPKLAIGVCGIPF